MGERIRFQLIQRTRPVRSALRVLVLLATVYYFLPATFYTRTFHHDRVLETRLHATRPPKIQHAFPSADSGADEPRLQAVKDEFLHAYRGYRDRAWLHDEVKPISGGTHTQYCGWAATLIDSLDTLYIMGLYREFDEAVTAVLSLSFAVAPSVGCSINPFEMTIRHLGGLIAAYDVSGGGDERLLGKALQMGEMLFQSYGKNRMQCRSIIWPRLPGLKCDPNQSLSLARLGSQSLELVRLSMISKNPKFEHQAGFLAREMQRLQMESVVPGLWPLFMDGTCPAGLCPLKAKHQVYSMGSASDSAYEYLLKVCSRFWPCMPHCSPPRPIALTRTQTHLLYGGKDFTYGDMWQKAGPKIKDTMLFQPMAPNNSDLLLPGVLSGTAVEKAGGKIEPYTNLEGKTEHLTCFLGGHFALSAKLYNNPADLDIAAKLTNGCVWAYTSTRTGIAPDSFSTYLCKNTPRDCPWNQQTFANAQRSYASSNIPEGFLKIDRRDYILRPEAIESVFILYRTTGDLVWREKGWAMFQSIRNATRVKYGHAGVKDVMEENGEKLDKMESFWLSETLKYFYLLFAEPGLVSLDEWVFNTEAHPFRLEDEFRGHG
jgi:mannosyl-oligosaccharide alpha-1,2-mannosidase